MTNIEKTDSGKLSELRTFPVPLALSEIKDNVSICTNGISQNSKEQLMNKAFKFHSQGNILEAAKYYQYFINQGFKDHRVFSNYGTILKNDGNLQDAELYSRKAIELNPNFAEAHSNLGNTLKDLGRPKEAEIAYRKAIELKPEFANAHSNLGTILIDLGKLKEAELYTRKAIELNPNFAEAYLNLGTIFKDLGKSKKALDSYIKVIEINPRISNIYTSITSLLRDSDISQLNQSNLQNALNILLSKADIPHEELFRAFNYYYKKELQKVKKGLDSSFSEEELFIFFINSKLVIKALKQIIFKDIEWEKILTRIRSNICIKIADNKESISYSEFQFLIALAEQCFLNEYIYSQSIEDNISIKKIIKKCQCGEINEQNISILACFFPLYKLLDEIKLLKTFDSNEKHFKELIKLNILDPLKEIELSQRIKKIGSINDDISRKVKSQYEENPYPRWKAEDPHKYLKTSCIQAINTEISPNIIKSKLMSNQIKVLIAGCGTGRQILQAQRYINAQITGIDLSSSSLSYAQRKINELGIKNVELIQMDILEVDLLKEEFDIIECAGVLICMKDPNLGLKKLLNVSKKNSFLKLGLYSELARQDIVNAREYIYSKSLKPTNKDMRSFRNDVISGQFPEIQNINLRNDFYSFSSCRDLCFHVQEHRFTIDKLQETLISHKLKFLGFLLPQPVKALYNQYFPEDKDQTNLKNWAKFETKFPNTFRAMYQFWVTNNS